MTHKFLTQDVRLRFPLFPPSCSLTLYSSPLFQFFEIHQYLGNAIAIVIKLKTQIKKTDAVGQANASRGDQSPVKELKRGDSVRSHTSDHSEYGDDAESTHSECSMLRANQVKFRAHTRHDSIFSLSLSFFP